ncbi:MAG TPA: CopG family transcriptional regulator [Gemmatimonadaceae bacterium]|nr:CopG family transcriptional regulator [Gemmatimonadaceae bacterium]
MDTQLTLRLDGTLADRLDARARQAGVKRSAVVRAALEAYLAPAAPPADRRSVKERMAPYVGILRARPASERDELERTLRAHNWRV